VFRALTVKRSSARIACLVVGQSSASIILSIFEAISDPHHWTCPSGSGRRFACTKLLSVRLI
jgi:hypothetical protein